MEDASKSCTKCGITKSLAEFYPAKEKKDGRRPQCAECTKAQRREYHKNNPDVGRAYGEKWRLENPSYAAEWAEANAHHIKEINAAYYIENRGKFAERSALWKEKNPERAREIDMKAYRKRQATAKGKLDHAISAGVYASLKGAKSGRGTYELLGYSLDDLMAHLEPLFQSGMSWDNYGEWHVDHIIPKSIFNYGSPDHIDFKRAWALSNLQPLWAAENQSKHAKYSAHFQPSLALTV